METTLLVVGKILAMFLVILAGWLARRRQLLAGASTAILSRFTTDLALPALIFTQMLRSIDRATLAQSWFMPLLAPLVLLVGQLIGWASWRLFATRPQAPSFIFVVSVTNWIYLPLPIVAALYGPAGIGLLLLCNAGVQLYLWTVGVATLHHGHLDRQALIGLARNPGLLATVAGIVVALLEIPPPQGAAAVVGGAVLEAAQMLGSLTIPMALVVTGAQLSQLAKIGGLPARVVWGAAAMRLGAVPAVCLGLAVGLQAIGWGLAPLPLTILFLIAVMPTAISCSILAERFGQDARLAAEAIFYTTLVSVVTVPLWFAALQRMLAAIG